MARYSRSTMLKSLQRKIPQGFKRGKSTEKVFAFFCRYKQRKIQHKIQRKIQNIMGGEKAMPLFPFHCPVSTG
jgi:hypothetical protein